MAATYRLTPSGPEPWGTQVVEGYADAIAIARDLCLEHNAMVYVVNRDTGQMRRIFPTVEVRP